MSRRTLVFVLCGLLVAVGLAFGVSRFASSQPDGLEKVVTDQALDAGAAPHALADGPLADYSTKGIGDPGTSTGVAGVVGVAVVFTMCGGLVWARRRVGRRRFAAVAEAEA